MQIKRVTKLSPALKRFTQKIWDDADIEHYGTVPDFSMHSYVYVAYDGKRPLGRATINIKAGVGEVREVVVSEDARRGGVGSALVAKLESVAKKHGVHKIWLQTGRGWKSEGFYRKLGYQKTGALKHHYAKRDFVIYSKSLNPRSGE